ncbi:MAG TPA: hypothetical protein VIW23_12740 [Candidatus Acidoferrum sp.]|jgi:hypothetical protein
MENAPETKVKREYHRPKLQVYGDLTQMTNAATIKTTKSDHSGGKFKTT